MKYYLIIFLFLFSACSYKRTIKVVLDGDTVITSTGEHIRLKNVDCPEKRQSFGSQATEFTRHYLQRIEVTIKPHGKDKYHRTIGDIYLPDGRYFNQMLIKAGLCYVYPQYSPDSLYKDELAARAAKIGLWALKGQISPYNFRHNNH